MRHQGEPFERLQVTTFALRGPRPVPLPLPPHSSAHTDRLGAADPGSLEQDSAGWAFIPVAEVRAAYSAETRSRGYWRAPGFLYVCGACFRRANPERERSAVSARVEQAAGFAQIERVESLLEPLVDREDHITYLRRAGTAMRQASEAHGGAQLE